VLPRHFRLRHHEDFEAARQKGKRWHDQLLLLNVLPCGLPHSRFGFVVSRKVGNAATRNLLKRRLRAVVWRWLPRLTTGCDVVIVARPAASSVSYRELETVLVKLLGRADLLVSQNADIAL
jgi:ribonuclease P protein component